MKTKERCSWTGDDPMMVAYHDHEWGVPVHDDRLLFEFLVLEGAQAGLSWATILKKRENYRAAFDNFDPAKIAAYDEDKILLLLQDSGIIRNSAKVRSAVTNAIAFLDIQKEFGSFAKYIWGLVDGKTIRNSRKSIGQIPAKTREAEAMSKDMKRRGFKFVGPTICYAFMQTIGMVNDHTTDCFRFRELSGNRSSAKA